jgi:anion-transporting  ArsA/GET3 family ATPase
VTEPNIDALLRSKNIIVMVGAGGVGKTTSSALLAIRAAMSGRRVALLSIDPAKRLASALGLGLGHEMKSVALKGAAAGGSLHAAMLDQKAVFDRMVRTHAPSEKVADRIMRDPLYRAASTNLSGPLEYMALARLQELTSDPSFDLVVLDTPPDTHALDFLKRPNVLAGFMENRVMTWIIKPVLAMGKLGLGKILGASEKLAGGVASVTGFGALRAFGEFLLLMQEVIEGFHKTGEQVVATLQHKKTAFVLVAVPTRAAERSAIFLADQLADMDYRVDGLVINRCLPGVRGGAGTGSDDREGKTSAEATSAIINALPDRAREFVKARIAGEDLVIQNLLKNLSSSRKKSRLVVRIEDQGADFHDMDGLTRLALSF